MALSVAHSIPEEFRREFTNNLEHEIQQVQSKFSGKIKIESFSGKDKVFNSMESFEFSTRAGRLQQSAPTEVELHARKLTKVPFFVQKIFDKWDKDFLGELGLPDSETIQGMKAAFGRLIDTNACVAATATVYGGEEPYVTAITLPESQKVAVTVGAASGYTNGGMSPDKILAAIQIFEENELDPLENEICIAINPKAKQDLIAYIEAATNDTWAGMIKDWLNGKTDKLMGLTPVMTNRLVTNASTDIDTCFAWAKDKGIYMAPENLVVEMDVLPTQQHALQISAYATLGFMRRFEKGVVEIPCDRSPALT
jgi:hypothetical protein